ncbi:MAG: response regulator transcription factor [Paracoccaceae bacterium]|jgi:DNA-binding NarL/FixJ family response regulator|nr:response regulator transcription factor [Paracoccaceae bacterium]
MRKCRIGLVDDHPIVLSGLEDLIQKTGKYDVVATGRSSDDALLIARRHDPDLMVMDLQMPGDVPASIMEITRRSDGPRVLVFTASNRLEDCTQAMSNGAMGYVVKGSSGGELFHALDSLALGEEYVSPCIALKMMRESRNPRKENNAASSVNLSHREDQIMAHLMNGASNKEIAEKLELSEKTVKYYMTQIMQKFNVSNRLSVVIAAQKAEWCTNNGKAV